MIPKPPGLVKIAGKVMNDREQQECIKLEFLPKPLYCENVVTESFFLDDQGFPRVVCVGRSRGQEKVCYVLPKSLFPSPSPHPTHTSAPAVALVPNPSALILYHPFPVLFLTVILLLPFLLINIIFPKLCSSFFPSPFSSMH